MTLPSHPAFAEALLDLHALGVGPGETGTPYGLVAARSNARWWLIPLASGREARAGLDLFQPTSRLARTMKEGSALACRLGLQRLAFSTGLSLSGATELARTFPGHPADSLAIFTGTDGPHRKTSIQFAQSDGRILGYGKLSRSPTVIPWIEAEARRLDELASLGLASADLPSRLDLRRGNSGAVLLLTDSRKAGGFVTPRELLPAHRTFLRELAMRTAGGAWADHLGALRARVPAVSPILGPEWRARLGAALARLEDEPALPLALAHGDLTPWNCFFAGRLYVFDWEYAGRRAAGHDAVHFALATHPGADATTLREKALAAVAHVHPDLPAGAAVQALLAYLCDHTLLFARRETEGLRRRDGWDGADRLARLFDACGAVR